jgi:hypothetical protein
MILQWYEQEAKNDVPKGPAFFEKRALSHTAARRCERPFAINKSFAFESLSFVPCFLMKKKKDNYQHDDWHTQHPTEKIFSHDRYSL